MRKPCPSERLPFAFRNVPVSLVKFALRITNTTFCVSQVGVFFDQQGRVLTLHHVYRHHYSWGLPAGFLTAGEAPESGLLRELKEETGLLAQARDVIAVRPVGPRHLEIAIWGVVDSSQPIILNHEIFEAVFTYPSDLPAGMRPEEIVYVNQARTAAGP